MKLIGLFIFTLGTSALALADTDRIDPAIQSLSRTILKLEHADGARIKKLLSMKPHCENQLGCYLTEADVYPNGSSAKILLFRGEGDRFSTPGVSMFLRHAQKNRVFCSQNCTFSGLTKKMDSLFQDLIARAEFSHENENDAPSFAFDEKTQRWLLLEWNDQTPVFSKLPTKTTKDAPNGSQLISDNHLQEGGLSIRAGASVISFDPLVSFSYDPQVALNFATPENKSKTGRFLVLAVDKTALRKPADPNQCPSWQVGAGGFFIPYSCFYSTYESYQHEDEVDALYIAPESSLRDVLLIHLDQPPASPGLL